MDGKPIVISEEVFQRLSCERSAGGSGAKDDAYRMKKLAEKERQHTEKYGLTNENFSKKISALEDIVGPIKPPPCVEMKNNLLSCLEDNDYQGSECVEILEQFTECLEERARELAENRNKPETEDES